MKHKLISFLLLMMAAVALFTTNAGAADVVDDFIEDVRAFEETIYVPVRDFDALFLEASKRCPQIAIYCANYSYSVETTGLKIQMKYAHKHVPIDEIYVVSNEDQMMAAIGLMCCDYERDIYVVATDGYSMDVEWVNDRLTTEYYLVTQCTYFWLSESYSWNELNLNCYRVSLACCGDKTWETVAQWRQQTEQKVLELAGTLFAQDMPDYRKVYLIHNWLVDYNDYNYDWVEENDWLNHVAYSALCEGYTVCQGYAEAAVLLCQAAGVPCKSYFGDAGGAHLWNCVELDGTWYQMDATWDDTGACTDFFLINDAQIGKTHTWDPKFYPVCTADDMSYEKVEALIAADTNVYTDYSTENVLTVEKSRAAFEAILGLNQPTEEPVVEPEEPVVEPEEPVEEPVEEPEEPVEEPEEPIEEPEEPVKEPDEPVEEPEEPAIEPVLPEELQPVVLIDQKKQQEYVQLNWVALLIALAVFTAVAAIALHCVANSRVATARGERQEERENRVKNGVQKRRRF